MTNKKHTPGPSPGPYEILWHKNERDEDYLNIGGRIDHLGERNILAAFYKTGEGDGDMLANAQLYLAAPDLLAASKALLEDVDSYGLVHPEGGRFEPETAQAPRAAIAKAEATS